MLRCTVVAAGSSRGMVGVEVRVDSIGEGGEGSLEELRTSEATSFKGGNLAEGSECRTRSSEGRNEVGEDRLVVVERREEDKLLGLEEGLF
jgi:hypothetical protein